jgi:serine/threonine protein kinase
MADLLSPDAYAAALQESEWSADELIPFGKYMLLDRISGGGTSAVYRANVRGEAGFERLVAIKRILPHMAGDPEFVKTFVREAKTVARLTHANICPIYELGKVGESLYMAIEYIAGKDLGKITRRLARNGETMPPSVAAFIAARLCDSLDYAHSLRNANGQSAGVVHRDLSPTNIIVSYEGQVKLIDFGLAKAVGRAQQTNVDALKKKLGYMSPEMVKGRPLDSRSDIFGVGVSLYEMLTGKRLFVGKDDIDTLKLVGTANVPPPSAVSDDVPDDLEVVVMRALEREPEDRFQTAGEMGQILNAYVQRTVGSFTTQQLSEWVLKLFAMDVIAENARIKRLLAASADNTLMAQRRAFFASPTGAAARARAEIQRRLSTDPPPSKMLARVDAPSAPPIPRENRPRPVRPPARAQDEGSAELHGRAASSDAPEEATSFYDRDKTVAGPAEGVHSAETRLAPVHVNVDEGGFDDEPTHYVNASSASAYGPNSIPP